MGTGRIRQGDGGIVRRGMKSLNLLASMLIFGGGGLFTSRVLL